MNKCKELAVTVGGTQITVNDKKYARLLSSTGILLGVIRFVAMHTGFATEMKDGKLTYGETKQVATVDGKQKEITMSFKDMTAAIIKAGLATAEDIKALEAEYKAGKEAYYSASTQMAALIGADASLRKVARPVFGQKGNHIGFDVKARYVKDGSNSGSGKVALLEAKIAKLTALLGEQALLKA